MSKRRSDALTALITEIVDGDAQIASALEVEEVAYREHVAAEEAWQMHRDRRGALEQRVKETGRALAIIASRDNIADDVIEALKGRLRR